MLARVDDSVCRLLLVCVFPILILAAFLPRVLAVDETKKPTYPVEMMTIETILVDENGKELPNVKASVYGVRCLEDRGSWYSWPSENAGPIQEYTSSQNGKIELRYPVKYGVPEKWLTTTTLDIVLSHPDIVPHRTEFTLGKVPERVVLASGCKVELRAIDSKGEPVDRVFPMISTLSSVPKWSFEKGWSRTGGLPEGKQVCMLVSPCASGTLFGPLMMLETSRAKELSIPDVVVRPGKRAFGKLPANVPRPIVDGIVSIEVLMDSEVPLGGKDSISWSDTASIAEDGSFEFLSVPSPCQLQVIAICRGWIIETIGGNSPRVKGKTIDFKKENRELDVEFEMEQTGDIQLELMSTDGVSIAGAEVSTWPNKSLLSGGSTNLTSNYRSVDMIARILGGDYKSFVWEKPSPDRHFQISDSEGMVTLRDIPVGSTEEIHVSHPLHELPYEPGAVRNVISYKVRAGETEERLLVLQKRESAK